MVAQQGVVNIRNKAYRTVALRVELFREKYPLEAGWGITTELVECTPDSVLVRAAITSPEGKQVATGYAHETWESPINKTSAVENCETSAIGRALAAAGFGGEEYASANEVQRAVSQQEKGKTNRPNNQTRELPPVTPDVVAKAQQRFEECSNLEDAKSTMMNIYNALAESTKHKYSLEKIEECVMQFKWLEGRFTKEEMKELQTQADRLTGVTAQLEEALTV